jgi:nucleotide-binding universal stress UspA family protein
MFEKILVATDGSKHSEDAADAAMEMAKLCKGKVTALYVIDVGKEFAFSDI